MQRYKRILVGVDGSAGGFHALTEAIRLAQWSRGSVTALAVVPSYEGDLSLVGVKDIKGVLTGPCEEILGRALETAKPLGTDIEVRCEAGEPEEVIVEYASMKGYEVIVLGGTRRSAIAAFFGSVASKIVRASTVEVLVVPEHAQVGWERILLVSDALEDSDRIMEQAAILSRSFGGRLSALMVAKSEPARDPATVKEGPQTGTVDEQTIQTRWEYIKDAGSVHKTIIDRAKRDDIRLIIVAKGNKASFRFWERDLSQAMIPQTPCPVLVLPSY